MCLICVEFNNDKLTIPEARRNLGEMMEKIGIEHAIKVNQMINNASREKEISGTSWKPPGKPTTIRHLQRKNRKRKP